MNSSIEAVQQLRAAGMDPKVSEALVIQLEKIIDDRVATKADLLEVKHDLQKEIKDFRNDLQKEIQDVRNDLQKEIQDVRKEMIEIKSALQNEIQKSRYDASEDTLRLRNEMEKMQLGLTKTMYTLFVLNGFAVVAISKWILPLLGK